jgi:hypothetical protein
MSFVFWDERLVPNDPSFDLVPFTRSPGRTMGGVSQSYRTDRGFWRATLDNVQVVSFAERAVWNAIRATLGGKVGLCVVPVFDIEMVPFEFDTNILRPGRRLGPVTGQPHDDGTLFSDGTGYRETGVDVELAADVKVGDVFMKLRNIRSSGELEGVRFSIDYALYETGQAVEVDGGIWTLPVFPAARLAAPAGTPLEFDRPKCLMHLESDSGMDLSKNAMRIGMGSVRFVEATDWFAAKALEDAAA